MPVKRRTPKTRRTGPPDWQLEFLLTGKVPDEDADEDLNPFELSEWEYHRGRTDRPDPVREAWEEHGEELLRDYISAYPGRRCYAWWAFDAPELPRRRLGGTGTPSAEVLAFMPTYRFGLPDRWITAFDMRVYKSLVGKGAMPIDPNDPPRYESESAYLVRHGLITEKERKALLRNAFIPVIIKRTPSNE